MDLRDWFRGRDSPPISKLLDLAERLPRHSVYRAAVSDDEDTALALIEQQEHVDTARPSRFGMEGWTYERELLVGITEAIMSLRAVTLGVNSKNGKVPKVHPLPRPKTAVDRVGAIASRRKREGLLAQLVPHEGHLPPA